MKAIRLSDPPSFARVHDLPGPGTPLVLVHGLGCASSCDYPRVVNDTALAKRRFVLVDMLGSGFSDKPLDFDYSIESQARVLIEILDALELSKIDLYGHSMGGTVALVAACIQPTRIRHLVMSEPNLDAGGGMFSQGIAAQSEAEYVLYGHAKDIRAASESGNHVWAGSMAASAAHAVHRAAKSLVRGGSPSWREQLLALPASRTLLFGEHSLPNSDVDELSRHGISVDIIPNAGHSIAWENPSGLSFAINRALASDDRAVRPR
jgi:pimeloyl-ACP methyl ester carboxylesterase